MVYPYLSERVVAGERRLGIVDDDGVWRMTRCADPPGPYPVRRLERDVEIYTERAGGLQQISPRK